MRDYLISFITILLTIMQIAIFARALMSWFPVSPDNPLVKVLHEITEPVLAPLRRVLPRLGPMDLSPMIAIIIILVIQQSLVTT
ncbi:MAG: YggT family protein [Chloroflexi bacterium]|nr:YggT family protein [Chloroflexota bacterium]